MSEMKVTVTKKGITAHYADYVVWSGNVGTGGPARVVYSLDAFRRAARHYGWGQTGPLELVEHMGDQIRLFEVLVGSLEPVRVLR